MGLTSNAPTAIWAALCVAALGIVGSYTFAFAAHLFFAISDATSGGQDDLTWPDEPLLDRLGKGVMMAWLVLVSLGPGFIIGRALSGDRSGPAMLFAASLFGLVFPLVLLSVQASGAIFGIVYWPTLSRVFEKPGIIAGYYLAVLPVWIASGIAAYGLVAFSLGLAPFFALALGWAIMTTARLYGRLALKVSRIRRKAKSSPAEAEGSALLPPMQQRRRAAIRVDRTEGYGVRATDAPIEVAPDRPGLKRLWIEDDDDGQPIPMQEAVPRAKLPDAILNPSEKELELAGPRKPPKAPALIWTAGTYSFALRPSSWGRLAWLTTGIFVCAALLRPIIAAN
jgi:hypothetical protein